MDEETDLWCPFCRDGGFDLVGLKGHLLCCCEVFRDTESPDVFWCEPLQGS